MVNKCTILFPSGVILQTSKTLRAINKRKLKKLYVHRKKGSCEEYKVITAIYTDHFDRDSYVAR